MFKSFSVYALTSIIGAAIPLLLLPLLTRHLTPFDYGVVAMFSTLTRLVVPVMSVGSSSAISVEYFRADSAAFARYVPSALLLPIVFFAFLLPLSMVPWFMGISSLWGLPSEWGPMVPIIAILIVLQETGVAMMRNVERPGIFAATRLGRVVFESGLTVLLVVVLSYEWRGRAWSAVLGAAMEAGVAVSWLAIMGFVGLRPQLSTSFRVARFGAPLVLEQLGAFVLNSSDRFFIETFVGLSAVGLYSVGAQFGSIILFVHSAFETAYLPTALRALESGSYVQLRRAVLLASGYLAALFVGWIALSLASPWVIGLVAPSVYRGAAGVVPWIGLGYVLMAVAALLRPVALYRAHTRFLGGSALGLTLLNLALNYVLVRRFGALGPAVATTISYACYAAVMCAVLGRELRSLIAEARGGRVA